MFGLSGGGSKSKSTGQSTSSSTSASSSFGQSTSVQGSGSSSISGGLSQSGNQATSNQNIAFEDVFARLFKGAEGAAAGLDPSMLTNASNQLFASGTGFLEGIGGDAGSAFLQERLAGAGALEQEQLALLQGDIGKLFNEELMPGITSQAVAGGQLGGGRQGVAQAGAIDAASTAFTRGAVDIRQRNQAQLDQVAAGIADRGLQGAQIGLGASPAMAALAEMGFGADTRAYDFLAGILGPQTALTTSQSTGFSSAEDFARAFSESFGRSQATDASASTSMSESQATSKSKGNASNIGIGFGA